MRNFIVLLLLALLSTSCSAIKGLRKSQQPKEDNYAALVRELKALSKTNLSRSALQRKLHSLFHMKYRVNQSDRRKLLFFSGLPDFELDFEDFDLEGFIDIISGLLGGGDDDEDEDEKGGKGVTDEDTVIEVQPGSVITTEQTTTYTITAPDGTVTTYTETTQGESSVVNTGAQFVAAPSKGNGAKGKGAN